MYLDGLTEEVETHDLQTSWGLWSAVCMQRKLAVNPGGPVDRRLNATRTNQPHVQAEPDLIDRISRFIDTIHGAEDDADNGKLSMLDIADQSFDAMQGAIARQKLAAYPSPT